jgi:hypothetical protein
VGDGLDEAEEGFGLGRRVVSVVPDQRQDPPVLLLGDQHEARGPARLGTDGDELLTAQCPRAQAQVSGGVLHVDRELLFRGEVVAERRQPHRGAAAAPGGVEDQVGAEGLLDAVCAAQDPHPGDAVPGCGGDEPDDVAPLDDLGPG